jgi:HAD superfamily phosphatase (TIGR01668 family)
MGFPLLPDVVARSLTDLSPAFLKSRNISLLMLDFDNTIVPYTTDTPTKEMENWLHLMLASDISLCVVSNSRKDRVKQFCRRYGIACICRARKPFSRGIKACMAEFGAEPHTCALVGDQIYTDVLGANCAGLQSILVRSIHNHTFWLKLRHVAELPFIFAARKRRLHYEKY